MGPLSNLIDEKTKFETTLLMQDLKNKTPTLTLLLLPFNNYTGMASFH